MIKRAQKIFVFFLAALLAGITLAYFLVGMLAGK